MYIDNKVYKQLINSKTPEEFWNNKGLLDIDNNIELNKDDILIRSLSSEEYNKYIINGTADGSISANNNNVYNHLFYPTYRGVHNYYRPLIYNAGAVVNTIKNGTVTFLFNEDKLLRVHPNYLNTSFTNDNILSCHCQDSNNELSAVANSYNGWIECYGELANPSRIYTYIARKINNISFCNKKSVSSVIEKITIYNRYETTGYTDIDATYTINSQLCFRPIFNFIDNNKSTNIFL